VACAFKMKISFLSLATSDVVWLNGPPFQPKLELSCFNCDQEKGNQVVHSVNNCWENFLKDPQANDVSFYNPGKLRRPSVASSLFLFPSMVLPLDPLDHSVRV
jgi:hypothetical protein